MPECFGSLRDQWPVAVRFPTGLSRRPGVTILERPDGYEFDPERVAGIVLVDSLGLAKFRPRPRFALSLIGFMARPSDRSHHRFMGQCLADRDAVSEAMGDHWDALREYSLDRARDGGVKTAMKFFMSELDDAGLASLRVPVSLIWGSEDKANKVSVAVAASERFGWPLHIIDGAADDPPMERPEEFVAAVLASSR